jgi:hypothetical protein
VIAVADFATQLIEPVLAAPLASAILPEICIQFPEFRQSPVHSLSNLHDTKTFDPVADQPSQLSVQPHEGNRTSAISNEVLYSLR